MPYAGGLRPSYIQPATTGRPACSAVVPIEARRASSSTLHLFRAPDPPCCQVTGGWCWPTFAAPSRFCSCISLSTLAARKHTLAQAGGDRMKGAAVPSVSESQAASSGSASPSKHRPRTDDIARERAQESKLCVSLACPGVECVRAPPDLRCVARRAADRYIPPSPRPLLHLPLPVPLTHHPSHPRQ